MKACLLDTHVLLWALMETHFLSATVRQLLQSRTVPVFASAVSFWEISLKFALGKLDLRGTTPEKLLHAARETGFLVLPIAADDAAAVHKLPPLHSDPFDRMLVQQALRHDLVLISKDAALRAYAPLGLQLEW